MSAQSHNEKTLRARGRCKEKGDDSLHSKHLQRVSHIPLKLLPLPSTTQLPILIHLELLLPVHLQPKHRSQPLPPFLLLAVFSCRSLIVPRRSTKVDDVLRCCRSGRIGRRGRGRRAVVVWFWIRGGGRSGEVAIVVEVLDRESSEIRRNRLGWVEEEKICGNRDLKGQLQVVGSLGKVTSGRRRAKGGKGTNSYRRSWSSQSRRRFASDRDAATEENATIVSVE